MIWQNYSHRGQNQVCGNKSETRSPKANMGMWNRRKKAVVEKVPSAANLELWGLNRAPKAWQEKLRLPKKPDRLSWGSWERNSAWNYQEKCRLRWQKWKWTETLSPRPWNQIPGEEKIRGEANSTFSKHPMCLRKAGFAEQTRITKTLMHSRMFLINMRKIKDKTENHNIKTRFW